METIYLIALEILIILEILKFFSLEFGIFFSLIFIVGIFIFKKNKSIFLLILPLLFLFRAFFTFNSSINIGDNKIFNVSLYEGKGKIEKIDNRYPLNNSYLYISNKSNGNYEIMGQIENIENRYGNDYLTIKSERISPIPQNKVKEYFQEKTDSLLKNSNYDLKRVYEAVILGKGYRLTQEMREKFNYIGISHLMALSGFHIGLVISIISFLLPTKLPIKKRERNIFLLVTLTLYYFGIEHSPSLDRAYIMGVVYLLGKIFDENTELIKTLAVSFILSLIINPASINSISFQLSYGAVFAIAEIFPYFKTKLYKGKSKLIDSLILTLSIQFFLTPLLIYQFGVIQLLSFITNIVVVPVGSLFISIGFISLLLENFSLGFLLTPILNFVFKLFFMLVDFFYTIPFMSIKYKNESNLIILFYIITILGIFTLKFRKDYKKDEKIYKRTKISQ